MQKQEIHLKTKQKHSVKTLYDETAKLAEEEGKIPVLALRETDSKDILWIFKQEDLAKVLIEIDLNKVDKRIKEGTTIYDMISQQTGKNEDIYTIKKNLKYRLQEIFREKVLSSESLEEIKSVSVLLLYIETIEEYMKEGFEK